MQNRLRFPSQVWDGRMRWHISRDTGHTASFFDFQGNLLRKLSLVTLVRESRSSSCTWRYYESKVSDETARPSCPPPSGQITSCLTLSTTQLPKLSRWSPAHIPKVPSQTTLSPFSHLSVFRPVLMHLKLFASLSWEPSVLHGFMRLEFCGVPADSWKKVVLKGIGSSLEFQGSKRRGWKGVKWERGGKGGW